MMISPKSSKGAGNRAARGRGAAIVAAFAWAALGAVSCGYFSISPRDNVRTTAADPGAQGEVAAYNSSVLMGRVEAEAGAGDIMVAAVPAGGDGALEHYAIRPGPGAFMIYLPAGGYYLCSFTDADSDGQFRAGELSGAFRRPGSADPAVVTVRQCEVVPDLLVSGGAPARERLKLPEVLRLRDDARNLPRQKGNGEIAALYEERFCGHNAETGWWNPSLFMRGFGARIYFARPFDAGAIPVLFVHGAQGSPRDWAYFLFRLDGKRYQAWFFYYPTGIRLSLASRLLYENLRDLAARYRFTKIVITAHSMGGLVTHDLLVGHDLRAIGIEPILHVSLASPWSGFESAGRALRYPTKRLPVWHDVASGSPFINRILSSRIPAATGHYLFYGTRDSVAAGRALDERAYRAADGMFGFDVDHVGILSDRACFRKYSEILAGTARGSQ
jgi:pimeloyl-ACP methyl ester carboxylesterase